jgi:hypothetical protein
MKNIIGYDMADILALAGLARKQTMLEALLPALGLVAAGVVIGAGVGLFFAPESGRLLRDDVRQGVGTRVGQLRERVLSEKGTEKRETFGNNAVPHSSV